jgi:ABC-type antimicrobial peptide transport system permease subunit
MLKTIITIIFRYKALLLLFIVTSIPVSIVTIYSLIHPIIINEANYFLNSINQGKALTIQSMRANTSNSCIKIIIHRAKIIHNNTVIDTPIAYIDKESYGKIFGKIPKQYNEPVSISIMLKNKLHVNRGDHVKIYINRTCKEYVVSLIHYDRGIHEVLAYIITDNINQEHGKQIQLCYVENQRKNQFENILYKISTPLYTYSNYMIIIVSIVYVPILYIGYNRIYEIIQKDLKILYEEGVPRGIIKTILLIVSSILSLTMIIYGIGLGIFLTHISLSILRLFNIIIESRPLVDQQSFALITLSALVSNIVGIILALRRDMVENH